MSLRLRDESFQNPRTSSGLDPETIAELALHIGLHGLLNPILITADGLIIGGQRRFRAIEFLIRWFDRPLHMRLQIHEQAEFVRMFGSAGHDLSHEEISALERRTDDLRAGVPVRVIDGAGLEGVALAENLHRSDLSSFEIAAHLASLHDRGATGADLARLIGKSKAYVSRKLSTWRCAGPDLKRAWEAGELAEDAVQQLAELPYDDQTKALAGPTPRGRRGPAGRPPIEAVKDLLQRLEDRDPDGFVDDDYRKAVLDTLRWVSGQRTSSAFASIAGDSA